MAYQPTDPNRAPASEDEMRRQAPLDNELQPDPVLRESAQNGPKVAMFVVAIAVVLGVLFYGLNRTGTNEASTEPSSRTAQTQPASPPAPAGMRDVTPKKNTDAGVTTGAAPSRPAAPSPSPSAPKADNPGAK